MRLDFKLKILLVSMAVIFAGFFGIPVFASYTNLIPVMTANELPVPYVASTGCATNNAFILFDGEGAGWSVQNCNPPNNWLKIDLGEGNEKVISFARFLTDNQWLPKTFYFQASNDDINWIDLKYIDSKNAILSSWNTYGFPNFTAYRYYRLYVKYTQSSGYNDLLLKELEFIDLIIPNGYVDETPVMTADNLPAPYVVSADSVLTTNSAYKAFARSSGDSYYDFWFSNSANSNWLKIDLGIDNEKIITAYRFQFRSYSTSVPDPILNFPSDFIFQGSNNDNDWTDLDTQIDLSGSVPANWTDFYNFDNLVAYRYYRLYISANQDDSDNVIIDEFRIYSDVPPPPVDFDFSGPTSVLAGTSFDVSFNATSSDAVIQLCGLYSLYEDAYYYTGAEIDGLSCSFIMEVPQAYSGDNYFYGFVQDIHFEDFYSDAHIVNGYTVGDPLSDPPTMDFTCGNSTTTIGTQIIFSNDGYDDEYVLFLRVWDPQLVEWVYFDNPDVSDTLLTFYAWTPETAGLFTFYGEVYDNHDQLGIPDPFYIHILVYEDDEDDITLPVIGPVSSDPTKHFLIVATKNLISFLRLDDLWNWFVQLFKAKFPFSWFFSIFEIWDEQRILVSSMEEVDALKVEWVFPDTSSGFLSGQTFPLFDLQGAREHYQGFFDVIRIILINMFWLGFGAIVFVKVKKFIGDLSIND